MSAMPPKAEVYSEHRKEPICFSPYLYRARNLVEWLFNKIKPCRRITTRYDKLATSPSSSWQLSGYVLMSPRPSTPRDGDEADKMPIPILLPNKNSRLASCLGSATWEGY